MTKAWQWIRRMACVLVSLFWRRPAQSRLSAWLAADPLRMVIIGRTGSDQGRDLQVMLQESRPGGEDNRQAAIALIQGRHVTAVGGGPLPSDVAGVVYVAGEGGSPPSPDRILDAALDEWERRYAGA